VRELLPANNLSKKPKRTTARSSAGSLLFPRSIFLGKEMQYIKVFCSRRIFIYDGYELFNFLKVETEFDPASEIIFRII
jgi:hypothetical protein